MSIKYIFNTIYTKRCMLDMIKITLDKALQAKGISRYELAKRSGIQYQIIDNYYKNKVVRYDSSILDRICTALNCDISDILEYKG